MLVHQILCLLVFLGIHQFLDLVIVIVCLGVVVVVGTAGPESGLVKRNAFSVSPSEYISTHISVADEQSVKPDVAGGLIVPQDHLPA